jgi:ABC-2 type transport system ATP-binding protein
VALVGNEPPSADGLSVRQFLSWVREARRSGSNGRGPTVDETIHRAELRADAHVGALSRGGRQRLALAAALMITPEVLLLDDPLQALDESARRRFVEWIREEQQRGATIVVAVNSDADVRLLCDRVLRMEEGRLL